MKRTLYRGIAAAIVILTAVSCSPVIAPTDSSPAGTGKVAITIREPQRTDPIKPGHALLSPDANTKGSLLEPGKMIASSYSRFTATVLNGTDIVASMNSSDANLYVWVPAGTYTVNVDVYNYKMSTTVPMVSGSTSGVTVAAGGTADAFVLCVPTSSTELTEGEWTPNTAFGPYTGEASGNWTGTEKWYTFVTSTNALNISTNATCIAHYEVFDEFGDYFGAYTVGSGAKSRSMFAAPGLKFYIGLTSYSPSNGSMAIKCDSVDFVSVTGVTLVPGAVTVFKGEWISMLAQMMPPNATDTAVSWNVSNPAVTALFGVLPLPDPTVFIPDMEVISINVGSSIITVETDDGGYTDTCQVNVLAAPTPPWGSWTTSAKDGGAGAASAVALSSADHWYSGEAATNDIKWYSVSVTPGQPYWIYHDDDWEGSGTYSGDCAVYAFHADGMTPYGWVDTGYDIPLLVYPAESKVLIGVYPRFSIGTYAVGVHKP